MRLTEAKSSAGAVSQPPLVRCTAILETTHALPRSSNDIRPRHVDPSFKSTSMERRVRPSLAAIRRAWSRA